MPGKGQRTYQGSASRSRPAVVVLLYIIIMYKHAKTGAKRFFLQKTKKKIEKYFVVSKIVCTFAHVIKKQIKV